MSDDASLPFIIEVYEDWADYPSWVELEVEGQESEDTPRFATVADARQWLDAYLDALDEAGLKEWYEREERVRKSQALYERRLAVLEREGLGHQPSIDWGDPNVVRGPITPYKKPTGRDRTRYRVARDAPPCHHCSSSRQDYRDVTGGSDAEPDSVLATNAYSADDGETS